VKVFQDFRIQGEAEHSTGRNEVMMMMMMMIIVIITIIDGWTTPVCQGLLIIEDSRLRSDTPHSVGLLWTSDRPDAETSTWQHTTLTTDRHPCPRRDANPQSQLATGRRPTPDSMRSRRSATITITITIIIIIIRVRNNLTFSTKCKHRTSATLYTRWFKYDRDWFVCKQAALCSSCATLREWGHNLHPPSRSG